MSLGTGVLTEVETGVLTGRGCQSADDICIVCVCTPYCIFAASIVQLFSVWLEPFRELDNTATNYRLYFVFYIYCMQFLHLMQD